MKKISYSLSLILCLSLGVIFMGCVPEPVKPSITLLMYNTDVAQAEIYHLSLLDSSTLTPEQLLQKTNRETAVTQVNNHMLQSGITYASVRVPLPPPPPTPCPDPFGCLDFAIAIRQFRLGVLYQPDILVETDAARKSATPEPTATIQLDSQHVFAIGKLEATDDPIFKTAYFSFAMVDSTLDGKEMVMTITTTILKDGKQQAVEMNIPVPANTFSAD